MKWKLSQVLLIALAVSLVALTGCSEDDPLGTGTGIPQGPSISLVSDAGFIGGDAEINLGDVIFVKVSALPGDEDLSSISLKEDGANLATSRFTINKGAITSNNPFLITGTDVSGAAYELAITSDDEANSTHTYTVEVADKAGLTSAVSFSITVKGTPVTEINGVLLNQGGPAGQGGLNLNDGSSTGTVSSDPTAADAHIKDEGIDTDLVAADNWIQRISGLNGSVIKIPGANMPENFSYENITTQEALIAAFDVADALAETNDDGELVTPVVNVGDVFLVQNGTDYWILRTDEVNVVTDGNSDNYVFSIKK